MVAAGSWGNDCRCATGIQLGEQPAVVKCFVRQESAKRHSLDQGRHSLAVVGLSREQEEANEITQGVHQCHDLCGQPAAGSANGLMLRPPFAPLPKQQVGFDMRILKRSHFKTIVLATSCLCCLPFSHGLAALAAVAT